MEDVTIPASLIWLVSIGSGTVIALVTYLHRGWLTEKDNRIKDLEKQNEKKDIQIEKAGENTKEATKVIATQSDILKEVQRDLQEMRREGRWDSGTGSRPRSFPTGPS